MNSERNEVSVLTNSLTNVNVNASPLPVFQSRIGERGTAIVVFLKMLIISSSAIVETSSELNETGSELILISSELNPTIAEQI